MPLSVVPREDDVGGDLWENPDDIEMPKDLPETILWRLLVMPMRPRAVSKGGIHLPDEAREAQRHLNYVGKVLSMGALCGLSERFAMNSPLTGEVSQDKAWPVKIGDYVIYGQYAGQRMIYRGLRLLVLDDDHILGIVRDPEALKIYI